MPRIDRYAAGGGGGQNTFFGTGTTTFVDAAARDAYFTANPLQLDQYDMFEFLLIQVGTVFQRRSASAWINVTTVVTGPQGIKGDKGDPNDSYNFVDSADIVQSNANKDITATIAGITSYETGMEVIFNTTSLGSNDTATVRLQVNALGFQKLLKNDGTEFSAYELEPSTLVRAVYNGTDFITLFARRGQIHYLEDADVTLAGSNEYSATDPRIPGTGTAAPIVVVLKSQADNTGDVTLSLNGSTDYPVLQSDASQVPAGAFATGHITFLVFSSVGTVGWHSINMRPARTLKGRLLATLDIVAGDYLTLERLGMWTLESGVTELTLETLPGGVSLNNPTDKVDAVLGLPVERLSDAQFGWFIEILNGSTVVNTILKTFGDFSSFGSRVSTDDDDIMFFFNELNAGVIVGVNSPSYSFAATQALTMPDDYSVKVYLTEN